MGEPLIPGGYILLSRKIIESEIWDKPPLYLKVWLYILSRAQHKKYKGLKRGQLWLTIPEIQEACSWNVGFRKVTPTKDQIFNILEWMRKPANTDESRFCYESNDESNTKATMITTMRATRGLLVTVDNYSVYQDPKSYESNDEYDNEKAMKTTREQREGDTTNKNDKNDKNDNNKHIVEQIVAYLNTKINTNYKPSSNKTKELINARLNEGFELDDFKRVIDNKVEDWLNSEDMCKFLRPQTLFSNKFESYLNQPTKEEAHHENPIYRNFGTRI